MNLGYRMLVDPAIPEQADAIRYREYDTPAMQACLRLMPYDGVFLDIGANIGFFTCAVAVPLKKRLRRRLRIAWRTDGSPSAMLCALRGGCVYAFEPVAGNAERLKRNIALNGLQKFVRIVPAALGDRKGRLTMHVLPEGSANNAVGDNVMSGADRETAQSRGWLKAEAELIRLDDWVARKRLHRCDVIKIDVEGAEMLVFHGARRTIERFHPAIVGEFSPYWMRQAGFNFQDVIDFFTPYGYAFYREQEGKFIPAADATPAGVDDTPSYLLLPESRAFPR